MKEISACFFLSLFYTDVLLLQTSQMDAKRNEQAGVNEDDAMSTTAVRGESPCQNGGDDEVEEESDTASSSSASSEDSVPVEAAAGMTTAQRLRISLIYDSRLISLAEEVQRMAAVCARIQRKAYSATRELGFVHRQRVCIDTPHWYDTSTVINKVTPRACHTEVHKSVEEARQYLVGAVQELDDLHNEVFEFAVREGPHDENLLVLLDETLERFRGFLSFMEKEEHCAGTEHNQLATWIRDEHSERRRRVKARLATAEEAAGPEEDDGEGGGGGGEAASSEDCGGGQ